MGDLLVYLVFLVIAIALVFLVPYREVTQPPGRRYFVWEILFPGVSPRWSYAGGAVLLLWVYFLLQLVLLYWKGSPVIITFISTPNLEGAYGVPATFEDTLRMINPSWVWLYLAPAVLFAVNLVLVLRGRRA